MTHTMTMMIPSLEQQTIARLQKIQIGLGPVSKPEKRCFKIQIGFGPVTLCFKMNQKTRYATYFISSKIAKRKSPVST
jgi:hypothetical protein